MFEKARAAATFRVSEEAPHLIVNLLIGAVRRIDDSTAGNPRRSFTALPGSAGFGVYQIDRRGPATDPDQQGPPNNSRSDRRSSSGCSRRWCRRSRPANANGAT